MVETDNPVRDVIVRLGDRLGGWKAVADMLGCGKSTVHDWMTDGLMTYRRIEEVCDLGWSLDPPVEIEPNDFFLPRYSKQHRNRVETS